MESSRSKAPATAWAAGVLVALGIAWALIQALFTAAAASSARGDRLTQCGRDLSEVVLVGLTVGVGVLALAASFFAFAQRPRTAIAAVAAEGVLALVWMTSDVGGGGVGCVIG